MLDTRSLLTHNLNFARHFYASWYQLYYFYILASDTYVILVVKPFRSHDIEWSRHENEVTAENVPVVRETRGYIFSTKYVYSSRVNV